ncbi:hypothetical protein Ancab_036456, partial [Ancistrocladus abbreviatus]
MPAPELNQGVYRDLEGMDSYNYRSKRHELRVSPMKTLDVGKSSDGYNIIGLGLVEPLSNPNQEILGDGNGLILSPAKDN